MLLVSSEHRSEMLLSLLDRIGRGAPTKNHVAENGNCFKAEKTCPKYMWIILVKHAFQNLQVQLTDLGNKLRVPRGEG